MNKQMFFIGVFTFLMNGLFAQDLVINEIMYANKTVIEDADGDTPDFFELYNAGKNTINLYEYMVCDNLDDEDYWIFPNVVIEPGGYLVVFASGKNRKNGELHTDFKLSLMEDNLYLLSSNKEVIDSVGIQCVPQDRSLSCIPDGAVANRCVSTPTPEVTNNQATVYEINYQPDTLMVNHQSGFYNGDVHLVFENGIPQNQIRFTLDGDDPKDDDQEFTDTIVLGDRTPYENRFANIPFTIEEPGDGILKANIVRAQVYSNGCPASNEISNTYFVGDYFPEKYNVPVISVITDSENLFDDETGIYVSGNHNNYRQHGKKWEREVQLEIFDGDGNQIIDQNAGLRIHGRGSREAPQKSMKVYAREKYGKETFDHKLFTQKPALSGYKTMLIRSVNDWEQTLLLDELCQSMVSSTTIDYSATATSVMFLNGEYWGIYSLRERQDEHYVANNYGIESDELKLVSYDPDGLQFEGGSETDYNQLIQFLETADPTAPDFYDDVHKLIDLKQMQEYFAAELYLANFDFPNNNLKMWKTNDDTARWRYFFFDCDGCMIRTQYNHIREYDLNSVPEYPEWSTYILRRMLQNDRFSQEFSTVLYRHMNTIFAPERIYQQVDSLETIYTPLVADHCYRWSRPVDFVQWRHNHEMIDAFVMERPNVLTRQLIDNFGNPVIVYPNPNKGKFKVKSQMSSSVLNADVVNIQGQLVARRSSNGDAGESLDFDLTNLPAGVYIVQITLDQLRFNGKVIIQSDR